MWVLLRLGLIIRSSMILSWKVYGLDQTENPLDQPPVSVSEVPPFNEPVFSAKTVPEEVKFEAPIANDHLDPETKFWAISLDQPNTQGRTF